MKVYIAGATAEIERAKKWHQRLTEVGIEVVSTWVANVEAVGVGNPRHATREQRAGWARTCLLEVAHADVLWLLVPGPEAHSCGAWVELGFAVSARLNVTNGVYAHVLEHAPRLITSGDTASTIFTALTEEYSDDIDAFMKIIRLSRC